MVNLQTRHALGLCFGISIIGVGGILGLSKVSPAHAMSERPAGEAKPAASKACFYVQDVQSYSEAGNFKLVVTTYQREAYEVEYGAGCTSVDTSLGVAIRGRSVGSRVCGAFDADILARGVAGPERCPVTNVRHLKGDEALKYVTPYKKKSKE